MSCVVVKVERGGGLLWGCASVWSGVKPRVIAEV